MELSFFVPGMPAQKGNLRRSPSGGVYETSKNYAPWRDSILYAIRESWQTDGGGALFTGPVRVDLVLRYPRPQSHYRTGRHAGQLRDGAPLWKTSAPDTDKLCRAALDAFTASGVWRDDAQVALLSAVKQYAHTPGMAVTIEDAPVLPMPPALAEAPEPQDVLL